MISCASSQIPALVFIALQERPAAPVLPEEAGEV